MMRWGILSKTTHSFVYKSCDKLTSVFGLFLNTDVEFPKFYKGKKVYGWQKYTDPNSFTGTESWHDELFTVKTLFPVLCHRLCRICGVK